METKTWLEINGGWVGIGGLVLGMAGVVLAILFRPRQSKGLGWKYQSANRIIRATQAQRDRLPLKVVYGAQDVDNPNIIILRISNAGRQEIRVDDYDRPITIDFKKSKLLALDVIGQSSPSMSVTFRINTSVPNRVTLNPILLNAEEWIDLQFVTDGDIERPPVEARIVGQTNDPFDIRAVRWQRSDFVTGLNILLTVIIIIGGGLLSINSESGQRPVFIILFLLLYVFALYATVVSNRLARRSE